MTSWNQYLSDKWKIMRKEQEREEEASRRRQARREGREYKPRRVRRAEERRRQKRAKQREFAEELREYETDPQQYIESRRDSDTVVVNLDDNKGPSPPGVWVPYVGSQGGHGWENTRTGERKYQLEKPGTNFSLGDIDMESRWRDPPGLSVDDPDFTAPLSPSEFREFCDRRD
jgi:hypothetical protein